MHRDSSLNSATNTAAIGLQLRSGVARRCIVFSAFSALMADIEAVAAWAFYHLKMTTADIANYHTHYLDIFALSGRRTRCCAYSASAWTGLRPDRCPVQ